MALFTPLERGAWGGFVVAQARVFARIEDDLQRSFRLTHAEFEVLLRLWAGGRARLQDLAAQSLLSRSGTSRAVDRLVRAGLVERVGVDEDGRGAYAVLTRKGHARFSEAADAHCDLVREVFLRHFTNDEQALLASFWRRLTASPASDGQTAPTTAKTTATSTNATKTTKTTKTAKTKTTTKTTKKSKTPRTSTKRAQPTKTKRRARLRRAPKVRRLRG